MNVLLHRLKHITTWIHFKVFLMIPAKTIDLVLDQDMVRDLFQDLDLGQDLV